MLKKLEYLIGHTFSHQQTQQTKARSQDNYFSMFVIGPRKNSKRRKPIKKKVSKILNKSKSRTWEKEVTHKISSTKSNLKVNEVLSRKRNRLTIEQH